jgi:hypothetical protein
VLLLLQVVLLLLQVVLLLLPHSALQVRLVPFLFLQVPLLLHQALLQ